MTKIEVIKYSYADDGYGGKVPTPTVMETLYCKTSPLKRETALKDYGRIVTGGLVLYTTKLIITQGELFVKLNNITYTVIDRIETDRKGVYICEVKSR